MRTIGLAAVAMLCLSGLMAGAADGVRESEPVQVAAKASYRFGNVLMGGVEYATGLVWCANQPDNLFLRADGGGIWRFDRENGNRWICLTDNFPFAWRDLVTVDSMAVHPSDPQTIYIACGQRWGELHDVLKTQDGGKTWNRLFVKNAAGKPVTSDGNGENKQAGERLVIDANAPDVLWFATRNDGLLRSKDAGKTWQAISSFPLKGKPWTGLSFVALDPMSSKAGEPARRIIAAAQPDRVRKIRGGLFISDDSGETWVRVETGPGLQPTTTTCMRARVASDGTLYVTTIGDGVWKERGGVWTDITPAAARGKGLCGINLHPQDQNKMVVAETGGQSGNRFYYSEDAGKSWMTYTYIPASKSQSNVRLVDFPAWEMAEENPSWGGNASDIAFDPVNPNRVWHTSFSGACRLDGVGTGEVVVSLVGAGREQITCGEVVCPTGGAPAISGVWDLGGFRHEKLDEIPASRIRRQEKGGTFHPEAWKRSYQDVFGMDIQPGRPNRLVLCGGWQWNQTGEAAFSVDNGATFREFPTKPFDSAKFGRIAIGVNPANVVWAPMGNAVTSVFYTKDNGQIWFPSEGAPPGMIASEGVWSFYRCLAADRMRADVFYLYDRRDGKFYRSEDGGARFRNTATLPKQSGVHSDWHRLETVPYRPDDIWLALREQGLFRSSDGGSTWTRFAGIEWAQNIAFGRPRTEGDYPAVYLFGQIGGEKPASTTVDARLYRSEDLGKTWVQLNDETLGFAGIAAGFAGDMQTFGRVYITTSARGLFYGEPIPAK